MLQSSSAHVSSVMIQFSSIIMLFSLLENKLNPAIKHLYNSQQSPLLIQFKSVQCCFSSVHQYEFDLLLFSSSQFSVDSVHLSSVQLINFEIHFIQHYWLWWQRIKYMLFGSPKYFEIRLKKMYKQIYKNQYFCEGWFFCICGKSTHSFTHGFPDNMLILSALNKSDFFLKCLSQVDDTGSYIVVDGRGVNRIKRCIICFGELQCRHSHLILFTSLSI